MEGYENAKLLREGFYAMMSSTRDMLFIKDENLVYQVVSPPFAKFIGKNTPEEVIGRTDDDIFGDNELAKEYKEENKALLVTGKDVVDYNLAFAGENGQMTYYSKSKYILRDSENDNIIGILGIVRDITKDYIAKQHYQQELKYLFELPDDTYAMCYIDIDSWHIISQRRQTIEGGSMQKCQSVRRLMECTLSSIVEGDGKALEFYNNFNPKSLRAIYESGRIHLSFRYQRNMVGGATRWLRNDVRFLLDPDSGHLCVMLSVKDIEAKKRAEERLLNAAQTDRMTNLLNRQTTMEEIEKILKEYPANQHVLFMIDVDNFKALNDTQGHQAGDEFLIALAAGVRKNFRESDIVGRIGGDEFFALMKNIPDEKIAVKKAEDLLSTIQKICRRHTTLSVSGSIGISRYPQNGMTLEDLYAQADTALYEAKHKGKNQFVFAE